jgi:hypothetical protein
MSAKLVGLMEILEEKGTELRMPYSEHLEDGIFELYCKQPKSRVISTQNINAPRRRVSAETDGHV